MREEASDLKTERVSEYLLSERYRSTMNATCTGVTFPLPSFSGFLDRLCFAIFCSLQKGEKRQREKNIMEGETVKVDIWIQRIERREGNLAMAPWLNKAFFFFF